MFNQLMFPYWKLGMVADPGPELLLEKDQLAQIRLRRIDIAIKELNESIKTLELEKGMLKKQYKIQ